MLSRCFLDCSVGVGGVCHRTESNLFPFLLLYTIVIVGVFLNFFSETKKLPGVECDEEEFQKETFTKMYTPF